MLQDGLYGHFIIECQDIALIIGFRKEAFCISCYRQNAFYRIFKRPIIHSNSNRDLKWLVCVNK